MNKVKQIQKGYTITVTSWENDGDNYNTKSKVVQTKEEAKVWYDMMQLCTSKNNQPKDVVKLGNSYGGFDKKQEEVAINFIKEHHKILLPNDNIEEHEEDLKYWFCDLAGELLGHGEDYYCRVMAECVITYSPEDIYVEKINF
jgi:hypothetical protein